MKRKMLLLWGCIILLFSQLGACEKAPDEVKQNMEKYGQNNQAEEFEFSYCKVGELQAEKLNKEGYKNIDIYSDISFPETDSIKLYDMKVYENFCSEEVIDRYCKLFEIDSGKMQINKGEFFDKYEYDNENEKKHLAIGQAGMLNYISGSLYQPNYGEIVKEYDLEKEDISVDEVKLEDGKYPLKDLIENAQEWVKKNYIVNGMSFKATDVIVRENEEINTVSIALEYVADNIHFNNFISADEFPAQVLEMEYVKSDEPSRVTTRIIGAEIIGEKPVEEIIDFDTALHIASDTLSGFGTMTFSDVKLLYMLQIENANDYRGKACEARPMYVFLSPRTSPELPCMVNKWADYSYYFAVDAVSGEVYTDLDVKTNDND